MLDALTWMLQLPIAAYNMLVSFTLIPNVLTLWDVIIFSFIVGVVIKFVFFKS